MSAHRERDNHATRALDIAHTMRGTRVVHRERDNESHHKSVGHSTRNERNQSRAQRTRPIITLGCSG